MEFLSPETVPTVAQTLQAHSLVSVRLALTHQNNGWSLNTLLIDAFPHPLQPTLSAYCYNYGRCAFCSGDISGAEVSTWLLQREGTFADLPFQIPPLPELTTQIGKSPSHTTPSEFPGSVRWPYLRYEIAISSVSSQPYQDQSFLICEGCPFFPNFQTALFALLYGHATQWDQAQGRTLQGRILFRMALTDAWIEHVQVSPLSLSVQIKGSQYQNAALQIQAPPYPPFEQAVEQDGTIEYSLSDGIPAQVWVVLARERTWLDYLALDQRWPAFDRQTNLQTEPPDLATQIQALIAQGEGQTIEFKQDAPQDKDQMLKTIASFANDQGGVVILGVKDKTGEITGLKENASRKQDEIQNMIRSTVVPEVMARFGECVIDHRKVLAIFIEKGQSPPYGLYPTKPVFFVRRGATTFPARQEELRALARSDLSVSPFSRNF